MKCILNGCLKLCFVPFFRMGLDEGIFGFVTPLMLLPMCFYVKEPCKDWFERSTNEKGNNKGCECVTVEKSIFTYQDLDLDTEDMLSHLYLEVPDGIPLNENGTTTKEHNKRPSLLTRTPSLYKRTGSFMINDDEQPRMRALQHMSNFRDEDVVLHDAILNDLHLSEDPTIPMGLDDSVESEECFLLSVQKMELKQGDHVAVVGGISSGKTAFLRAILGEMICPTGHVSVHGSIAYCPQEPWIFPGTIQSNIILNNPMDDDWYDDVIEATCLHKDITGMPDDNDTVLTAGGANLSGGQRQRISIARAIYARKDIYIIDDPLSALDTKVSSTLFAMCFNGLLKDTTVIMSLNQLQFLPHFDSTLLIEESGNKGSVKKADGNLKMSVAKLIPTELMIDVVEVVQKKDNKVYVEQPTLLRRASSIIGSQSMEGVEQIGQISWSTFLTFIGLCGWLLVGLSIFALLVKQACISMLALLLNYTIGDDGQGSSFTWLLSIFAFGAVFFLYMAFLSTGYSMINGSREVHFNLLKSMLRAPISFFDTTPLECIMNLFTVDVLQMDNLTSRGIAISVLGTTLDLPVIAITSTIAIPFVFVIYFPAALLVGLCLCILAPLLSVSMLYMSNVRQYHLGILTSVVTGVHTMHAFDVSDSVMELVEDTLEFVNKAYFNAWFTTFYVRTRVTFFNSVLVIAATLLLISGLLGVSVGGEGVVLIFLGDVSFCKLLSFHFQALLYP